MSEQGLVMGVQRKVHDMLLCFLTYIYLLCVQFLTGLKSVFEPRLKVLASKTLRLPTLTYHNSFYIGPLIDLRLNLDEPPEIMLFYLPENYYITFNFEKRKNSDHNLLAWNYFI